MLQCHTLLKPGSLLIIFPCFRHQLSDPSKPEFSSDDGTKLDTDKVNADSMNGTKLDTNKVNADSTNQLDEQKESCDDKVAAAEPSYDCSKFVVDFTKNYECASPNTNLRPGCGLEAKGTTDYGCSSSAPISLIHEAPQRGEMNIDVVNQNREAAPCDWEHLVSDTSELLVFESPDDRDSYNKSVVHGTSFYTGIKGDMQNLHLICAVDSGEHVVVGNEDETLSTQPGEGNEMDNAIIAGPSLSNSDEKGDYEVK